MYRIDEVAPGAGHTVPPGAHANLAMTTAPDAVCWVHPDGDDDPAHRLRVYADSVGAGMVGGSTSPLPGITASTSSLVDDDDAHPGGAAWPSSI